MFEYRKATEEECRAAAINVALRRSKYVMATAEGLKVLTQEEYIELLTEEFMGSDIRSLWNRVDYMNSALEK